MFLSLNYNMNRHHHKYFSADDAFLQLLYHNVVNNSWNWHFANYRDLVLILPEAATGGFLSKKVLLKISQYSQAATLLKRRFSSVFCKNSKDAFFTEDLWMTGFILQQLLHLYFALIYSRQLSSSKKSLVGKENPSICLKDLADLEFLFSFFSVLLFSFSLANICLPCQLHKAYVVVWTANRFVGSETSKHNNFDQFWTFSKKCTIS